MNTFAVENLPSCSLTSLDVEDTMHSPLSIRACFKLASILTLNRAKRQPRRALGEDLGQGDILSSI